MINRQHNEVKLEKPVTVLLSELKYIPRAPGSTSKSITSHIAL